VITQSPRTSRNVFRWIWIVLGLAYSVDALAYVDPNASGLLYQLLFPLIVGLTVARTWLVAKFKKLWSLLVRRDR